MSSRLSNGGGREGGGGGGGGGGRDLTLGLFVQALKDLLPLAAAEEEGGEGEQEKPNKAFVPLALERFRRDKVARAERDVAVLRLATSMATVRRGDDELTVGPAQSGDVLFGNLSNFRSLWGCGLLHGEQHQLGRVPLEGRRCARSLLSPLCCAPCALFFPLKPRT